ncbi:MAG: VTT domain-containing protein [Bacteroidales bacterium]|nr:VTT domain-containing protein [Bacteroidales bacterium]
MINPGDDWFGKCIGLFFETFIQEDLAIVTGGLLVVKKELPLLFVAISLFTGILSGDIIIYSMGMAARKIPWIRNRLVNRRVENARIKLEKNLVSSIALVRILPGLLFPTYLACGLIGVSFTQFFITTLTASAIYSTILLTLVIKLGEFVFPTIGYWGWIIMVSLVLLLITYKTIKPRRLRLANNTAVETISFPDISQNQETFLGMPSLHFLNRKVSVSEKIPPLIFYTPLGFRWLMLGIRYRNMALPTIANPFIEAGGLWGESKSRLMHQVSGSQRQWIAPFATFTLDDRFTVENMFNKALDELSSASLDFPLVIKPDIGWQGYGVRIIKNKAELLEYFREYPKNNTIIIQEHIPYEGEAGVFYLRYPGESQGRVISLTFRYYPHVIGDGKSSVLELIKQDKRTNFKSRFYLGKDPLHQGVSPDDLESVPQREEIVQLAFIGSIRVGGLYTNGENYITPKLNQRFDEIACSMPEFYFGRFDIKFKTINHLQEAADFQIFEINGAGAEAIHVWDTDTSLLKAYKELFRYQSLLFRISDMNRKNGYKPMGMREFYSFSKQYYNLTNSYPLSQ